MKHAILLISALALSACASNGLQLSASQCAANWRSVGIADSRDGAPESKINEYRSACAASSPLAASDIAAWKAGWADGTDVASAVGGAVENASDDEVIVEEHDHTHTHGGHARGPRPVFRPSLSIGVGSGGVRGGVGLGVGFGLFRLGLGLGF